MILRAGHTLVGAPSAGAEWVQGGGLQIKAGRIERVFASAGELERAARSSAQRPVDLGDGLLLPGFVNAHAHLELTHMRLKSDSFANWIGAILAARRELGPADYASGVVAGEARLLETGTTCVGDIASSAASSESSRSLRSVVYREILDAWDPRRTSAALDTVRRALPKRVLRQEGLAPHAPYTSSSHLLSAGAKLLRRRSMPVSIHWAESEEEIEWLASGTGALAPFFRDPPRCSGLELIERAGLLTASTALVHGNFPGAGDAERLARAGVVLVHCPGTHQFFERAAFPWAIYRRQGVSIALGTDSRASNGDLDMRREMALARASNPDLDAMTTLGMATDVGARALGQADRVGSIEPGKAADLAFHVDLPSDPMMALEALTQGHGRLAKCFVAGRRVPECLA